MNLDDDVAAAVTRIRRERGVGVSEAVNELARAGLTPRHRRRPFRQRSVALGLVIDVSDMAEMLDVLEGPARR